MHVDGGHQRLGPAEEADADAGGEDLREAVEAQDSADGGLLELEREVRGHAGGVAVVEIVVGVVCSGVEMSLLCGWRRDSGKAYLRGSGSCAPWRGRELRGGVQEW